MAVSVTYSFGKISEFNEAGTLTSAPDAATDYQSGSSKLIMVRDDFRTGANGDGFHWNQSGTADGGFSDIGATNLAASGLYDSSNYVVVGQTPGQAAGDLTIGIYSPQGTGSTFTLNYFFNNARDADVAGLTGGGFVVINDRLKQSIDTSHIDVRIYSSSGLNATLQHVFTIDTGTEDPNDRPTTPSVAGLDNGNFVIAWTIENAVWFAIGRPDGTYAKAPFTLGSDGTFRQNINLTAIDGGGFAAVYETPAHSGNGATDVEIVIYDSAGNLQHAQILSDDVAASIQAPSVTRLSNGMLAVSYGDNTKGGGDTDAIVKLYDPVSHQVLATRNAANGRINPNTGTIPEYLDDVEGMTLAGFGNGKLGFFWTDLTANSTKGQILNAVRTTTGDDANNSIIGDSLADIISAGRGNDVILAQAGSNSIVGNGGFDAIGYDRASSALSIVHNADNSWTISGLNAGGADFIDTLSDIEIASFTDRSIALRELARTDVTGEGTSDFILSAAGYIGAWAIANNAISTGTTIANSLPGWAVVGSGDFNGDGSADVLLQSGGTLVDWTLTNGVVTGTNPVASGLAGWTVKGTGDVNGDGTGDIILQSGNSVVDFVMSNGRYSSSNVITTAAGGFTVNAVGDINADGNSDLILQNGNGVAAWTLVNGQYSGGAVLSGNTAGFTVVGAGDFDGDGDADVILQNGGSFVEWTLQNGAYQTGHVLAVGANGWGVVGTGDYNGDGVADVALQNGGSLVIWTMQGGAYQSGSVVSTGLSGWSVLG